MLKWNPVLLGLVSPVLRTMVCGDFRESASGEIILEDVDKNILVKLLWLAYGDDRQLAEDAEELFALGTLAERLQMSPISTMIEAMLLDEVKTESCVEMLQQSEACGLRSVRAKCFSMLLEDFDEVSRTAAFLELSEETMGGLVEDDELGIGKEEDVLEAVMRWVRGNRAGSRGEALLRKFRYGAMDHECLLVLLPTVLEHGTLRELVGEAMTKKGSEGVPGGGRWDGVERLCDRWETLRKASSIRLPRGTLFGGGALKNPRLVALTRTGRILVTDYELNQLLVFNSHGSVVRRLGSKGTAPGQFRDPSGVAVDRLGRIVIGDRNNHRIQVLNPDGSVAMCFGSEGSAVGELKQPSGVAVDRDGRIVVADYGNHRIQVFNADGSVARHFGSEGGAVGQLQRPVGVAVDKAGRIVVADCYNHRVQVFDRDGSVALCFGAPAGEGPTEGRLLRTQVGRLQNPTAVAVDGEGRFIVADWGNHRVQVFDSDGSGARVVGPQGAGVGQFRFPYGVAVDGAGRILVTEMGNGGNCRVQVV